MADPHTTSDPAFIARQRQRLEALREQLVGGEDRALGQERQLVEDRQPEAAEFEDRAQRSEEDEVRLNLRDVDDRRLSAIDRALQKIVDGSYGLSDESGEPIPRARLEATPEAVLTVGEEEERERRDRL